MPTDAEVVPLRERRRSQTLDEIKQAAVARLANDGHAALSLRAVARDVGVSVQALYHYFPSRDALLTSVIADSYVALADAVQLAVASEAGSVESRVVAAGLAYRRWALEHRNQFLLVLGVPLEDYAAPEDGATTAAAGRLGQVFHEVLFSGWSQAELEDVPLPVRSVPLEAAFSAHGSSWPALPPGAFSYFTTGWATLHGLVMLELLGHLPWVGGAGEDMCRAAMVSITAQLEAVRRGPGSGVSQS